MEKRIIDLGIVPEDDATGVSAIAFVDDPAIMVDFLFFKRQHKLESDVSGLSDYIDPGIIKKRIEDHYNEDDLIIIFELASVLGVPEEDCEVVSHTFADVKDPKDADYTPARTHKQSDGVEYLYKYMSSGVAGNHRSFCSRMMGLQRYYSREEIEALDNFNEAFGPGIGGGQYNIFRYKGGANCQHYWQKYSVVREGRVLKLRIERPEGYDEKLAATAPRTLSGRGFVKRPQRNLPPDIGESAFSLVSEEKHIIVSPILIPDLEIVRMDAADNEFFVKFSADTIAEIAEKFMKEARNNETNIQHNNGIDAGSYIFESWIVETAEDKAITKYGFDVPVGTWMGKFKVTDMAVWDLIKQGKLNGVSVEGWFQPLEEIENRRLYEKIKKIMMED